MSQDRRVAPLDMDGETFRQLGHRLVDQVAEFLDSMPERPVTRGETVQQIRALLGAGSLPEDGMPAGELLDQTAELLFEHSLHNGHPRFMGYITSSAAPLGMLADLLAAAVNPNVGGWQLSPVAAEIEGQCVSWIAELLGYNPDCGGLMVSGGNVANMVGFFAARRAMLGAAIREDGVADGAGACVYASRETHTWLQKAADLSGLGTGAIRWVDTLPDSRVDVAALARQLDQDRDAGLKPFMAVATAGTVSTGAIDDMTAIGDLCREHKLWFHVDGAYGAPAAALPELATEFAGLSKADSIAMDPHKWLYSPLEAACTLVRDRQRLVDAFSFQPVYYHFDRGDREGINYYEYGIQNSRGFRALKVWMALRQTGRTAYQQMIRDDIALARQLYQAVDAHPRLEAVTHGLSIATFRFVPEAMDPAAPDAAEYLNDLNRRLLTELQVGGEVFLSNAVVEGNYLLRACIVNFRTSRQDIDALPEIIVRVGTKLHRRLISGG
ncbi:MAG: pyridoxal-dependent decarboxylase [Gammaproteobacteria bacterium]